MHTVSRLLQRSILFAGGSVAGAYCAFAAYQGGASLGSGNTAIMFGSAFAAVVVTSWFLLGWAERLTAAGERKEAITVQAGWALALLFVLFNSVMFAADHRTGKVEGADIAITGYEGAKEAKATALATLATLKTNPRWTATAGCSNATAQRSKEFCGQVMDTQARIDKADAIMAGGRPGSKDAGAESISWVTGGYVSPDNIGKGAPLLWAVVLELMASLCMKQAFKEFKVAAPVGTVEVIPASAPATELTEEQTQALLYRLLCLIHEAGGKYRGQNRAAEALGVSASGLSDALIKNWRPAGYIDVVKDGPAYILVPGPEAVKVKA